MLKQEFLDQLREKLRGIPKGDLEERIGFYSEMIDDRIEEGLSEEEATAALGTIEGVYQQILSEIPLTKLVKETVKPRRTLSVWEIVLLVLGSPIWLSLALALVAIAVSIYAVIWSILLSVWAIEVSLAACFVSGVLAAAIFLARGNFASAVFILGVGLLCAGLAILGFIGCRYATAAVLKLSKRMLVWVKSRFIKKEGER